MTRRPAQKSKSVEQKRKVSKNWKSNLRNTKKRSRTSFKLKNYIAVFSLFLTSAMFVLGMSFYKKVTIPFVSASSYESVNVVGDSVYAVNVIYTEKITDSTSNIKKITVIFFDEKNNKIVNYDISGDMLLDMPGRYQDEKLARALFFAMSINNDDLHNSLKYLDKAVSNLFGFPVKKHILVASSFESELAGFIDGDVARLVLDYGNFSKFNDNTVTNLTLSDIYHIYKYIVSLPEDRIVKKELTSSYLQNKDLIYEEMQDLTLDGKMSAEELSIAVLNATDVAGIASLAGDSIRNMGGRVTSIGNSVQKTIKTLLVTDDSTTETVRMLKLFFDLDESHVVDKKSATNLLNLSNNEIFRSDITVILSVDLIDSL